MTLAEYRKRKGPPEHEAGAGHTVAHGEKHPGMLEYVQIGAILAAITCIEVGIYYLGIAHNLLVAGLIVLSLIKFSMVVLWFMHLKFDNRLFSSMFMIGLFTAMAVFMVALATLGGKLV